MWGTLNGLLKPRFYKLDKFVDQNPSFTIEKKGRKTFIVFNEDTSLKQIQGLLEWLWKLKFEFTFHDTIYPTISDPGAYFSYSTKKSIGKDHWSMTLGNHGWTGGIYQIRKTTVNQQVYNLFMRKKLKEVGITDVAFFSHYNRESPERSRIKDQEILQMHTQIK
jgi:hypothetical protein